MLTSIWLTKSRGLSIVIESHILECLFKEYDVKSGVTIRDIL